MPDVRIVRLKPGSATPIVEFASTMAASAPLADGQGDAHLYFVTFEPGGSVGPHVAGFGQLFFPILGSGWVAGEDGKQVSVSPGEVGYVRRGEVHSKGSAGGMTALIVQVRNLEVSTLVVDD